MFTSELPLLSSTYQALAKHYLGGLQDLNSDSLESFILRIIIYVSDNEEIDIGQYLNWIQENNSWFLIVNLLSREVVRELGLGQGCASRKVQEIPIDIKKELGFYEQSQIKKMIDFSEVVKKYGLEGRVPENISDYNQEYLRSPNFALYSKPHLTRTLSLEGESWISTTPYPNLFLVLREILKHLCEDENFVEPYKFLVKARLSFIHNLILDKPVGSLVDDYLLQFKRYLSILFKQKNLSATHYIHLQMEYFNSLLFAYKYSEAEGVLEQCKKVLNMDIEFTGKLGRRTKFQQFDTVQLVMNLTEFKGKQQVKIEDILEEEFKIIPAKELLQLDNKHKQPETVRLEEDSILFEKPKLNEEQETVRIDSLKQLVLVNIIYYMYETTPKDEILFLRISSMIAPLLEEKETNYAVKIALLALRSLNQLPRYKNSDRALEQLQQLVSQYNEVKQYDDQTALAIPSAYRIHLPFLKLVGEKVMGFGLVMTGVDMFQKAGLYEQCVEGLLSAGHKTKALELANRLLEEQGNDPSPYLLCLMGDATGDLAFYEKSWQLSKNTFARAQRTLGRAYFMKKEYEKCIRSYKKALEVNFYNPSDWFTLGCAYLSGNQFAEGGKAFSQSVSIDDSQGQGWGNLASCFIGQKKFNEAYGALAQALKYSESNWKLWQNMMGVSLKLKKFYKFMESISRLLALNAGKLITEDILQKLNQILDYRITLLRTERRRITAAYKNRIEQEYASIKVKLGERGYVWGQYANYLGIVILYLQEMSKSYIELHESEKLDQNDMVEGYEVREGIEERTRQKVKEIQREIVEAKQKQLNMTMTLGWETSKEKREQVRRVLSEYKNKHVDLYGEGDEDFNTFIKSIEVNIKVAESKEKL